MITYGLMPRSKSYARTGSRVCESTTVSRYGEAPPAAASRLSSGATMLPMLPL